MKTRLQANPPAYDRVLSGGKTEYVKMKYDKAKAKIIMIKGRVSIVDHIKKTQPLVAKGDKYFGKSPFVENASTESLEVRTSDQRFKCLKTGTRGDIIDWESYTAAKDFFEAVDYLSDQYEIDLSPHNYFASSERERAQAVAAFLKECNPLGLRGIG